MLIKKPNFNLLKSIDKLIKIDEIGKKNKVTFFNRIEMKQKIIQIPTSDNEKDKLFSSNATHLYKLMYSEISIFIHTFSKRFDMI